MTAASVDPVLLADVKNHVDITWEDEAMDKKVRELISQGMVYLNGKYGREADYSIPGLPRTLLMEYVRYARDNALDVFENDYLSMILAMQHERKVADYVESAKATPSPDHAGLQRRRGRHLQRGGRGRARI